MAAGLDWFVGGSGVANSTDSTSTPPIPTTFFQIEANRLLNRSLTAVSSSLSILGTLAIIFTFVLWKDVRTSSRKILVYISIADFFSAAGYIWSLFQERVTTKSGYLHTSCVAQSFVTTCSSMWSFFWTTFLAIFLYVSVAKRRIDIADKMIPIFHLFGWLVPVIITSVALQQHALGNDYDSVSAGWCWISSDAKNRIMWMLIAGKAWEIAAYILIAVFYALLKYHIYREVKEKSREFTATCSLDVARKAERKMTLIPVVFILLRIWGTIRFILTSSGQEYAHTVWLVYLQGVGDSGQGFANFMLFCFFTKKFQKKAKTLAHRYCCCYQEHSSNLTKETSSTIKSRIEQEQSIINERTHLIGVPSTDMESSWKSHT